MKKTIGLWEFIHEFEEIRPDNFSTEGLEMLFNFFESFDENFELDVIGICCDFSEYTHNEIAEQYDIDISDCDGPEETGNTLEAYLSDHTLVVGWTDDIFVIQDY